MEPLSTHRPNQCLPDNVPIQAHHVFLGATSYQKSDSESSTCTIYNRMYNIIRYHNVQLCAGLAELPPPPTIPRNRLLHDLSAGHDEELHLVACPFMFCCFVNVTPPEDSIVRPSQ